MAPGFPGYCLDRDHVRIWDTPGDGFLMSFGTPHREDFTGSGHSVTSWGQGRDALLGAWTSQYNQFGAYYCGWVWAGWYKGLYLGCGIEMAR